MREIRKEIEVWGVGGGCSQTTSYPSGNFWFFERERAWERSVKEKWKNGGREQVLGMNVFGLLVRGGGGDPRGCV